MMKCPRCGAGISQKLLDNQHYVYLKRKYRRYAPPGIRRRVCRTIVYSDELMRALYT